MKNRGILLLALGHPNYGGMAFNMAVSIRRVSNIHIHLVWHGNALNHLTSEKLSYFDSKEICPDECFIKNGQVRYFKAKTFLYDLSPFDDTLYLDVDMLWLKKPVEEMFELLKDTDFTMENRAEEIINEGTRYSWANARDLQAKGLTRLPNLHSEVIYFKKTERVKKYFDSAKRFYDNPTVKPNVFNGDVADELAFLLAQMDTGLKPHLSPFQPAYWMYIDRKKTTSWTDIYNNYYLYSLGGKQMSTLMKEKYDQRVAANNMEMGIASSWKAVNKSKFEKARQIF